MLNDFFISQFLNPLFFIKIVLLILLLFYVVFSFVVLNQVNTMNNIIKEAQSSTLLVFVVIFNMILAISLFVFSLVIL